MPMCFRVTSDHIKLVKSLKFEFSVLEGIKFKDRSPLGGKSVLSDAQRILNDDNPEVTINELHVVMAIFVSHGKLEEGIYEFISSSDEWEKLN